MPLINKPTKSKYQVGEVVFFLFNGKGVSAPIIRILSEVTNPNENASGIQLNSYYLEGYTVKFNEEELFDEMNALLYNIKGGHLNSIESAIGFFNIEFSSSNNLSYCNLGNLLINNSVCNLIDFSGSDFRNSELSGTSFQGAKLKSCNLSNANIGDANFSGANLTNSILPSYANTKASFKAAVGEGHWDPVTTTWIDGLPIGN